MIVCEKEKIIFYHVPKTAGTSIKTVLINLGGKKWITHVAAKFSKNYVDDFNSYVKVAVIRNPYSRTVSWYNHLIREAEYGKKKDDILKPGSFDDFVRNQKQIYKHKEKLKHFGLWTTQKDFLSIKNRVVCDYLMYYENLQEEWDNFCMLFLDRTYELPHMKKWGVQDYWKEYYDEELQEIVYNRMKEDFEYFGYSKNIN